jgi:hypothetical protein
MPKARKISVPARLAVPIGPKSSEPVSRTRRTAPAISSTPEPTWMIR